MKPGVPRYWGLTLDQSQIPSGLTGPIINAMGFTESPKEFHVTLVYSGRDLHNYWSQQKMREWELDACALCYDGSIMAVRIDNFNETIQNAVPHVTIAMTPNISASTSNNMLMYAHTQVPLNIKIRAYGPIPYYYC